MPDTPERRIVMRELPKARLRILAAAILFSTGGTAIKACGLDGWQVAAFRSGFAAIALYALLPAARRNWSWRTLLVGVAYAATLTLYVLANKLTTAANTIFLQSTAPMYLLLISPLLLKEKIRMHELGFMGALAAGLALFLIGMEPPQQTAPDPPLGNILGAASGLCWGLTIAGLRWLARAERDGGGAAAGATVVGNALVFLCCAPMAIPVEGAGMADWLWVLYLGVFQIALAYVFMTVGLRRVPALEVSLLLLLEPVLNTFWTWLVHGEVPGPWSRLGAVVILVATIAYSLLSARKAPATPA